MEDVGKKDTVTVSELSSILKASIEEKFRYVQVRGEVSGLLLHTSGHMYFSLKDANAVVDCVCWRSQVSALNVHPEDGMDVVCVGKVTTYAMRSKYQVMLYDVRPFGVGELLKLIQERKKKLEQEGLFDKAHKKPLPKYPRHIAVLTSPTGAVLRDILHRLRERYPCLVQVWPVVVQGTGAAQSVIDALNALEASEKSPDVVIIARGGGSIEDLMPFQDEQLARRVFSFNIPVVSAIGHETDVSILDYVADMRAPTPTGAAEIVTPHRQDLLASLDVTEARLRVLMMHMVRERSNLICEMRISAQRLVETKWLGFDELWGRVVLFIRLGFEKKSSAMQKISTHNVGQICLHNVAQSQSVMFACYEKMKIFVEQALRQRILMVQGGARLVESFSPHAVMRRGYTVVKKNGRFVYKSKNLCAGDMIDVIFVDGERKVSVEE